MNQRGAAASLCAKTFRKHFNDAIELFASEIPIWPCCADQLKEIILIPIFRGSGGNGLLTQDIERLFGNQKSIKLTAINATQQRRAFDQSSQLNGKMRPFGRPPRLLPAGASAQAGLARPTRCSSVAMERVLAN